MVRGVVRGKSGLPRWGRRFENVHLAVFFRERVVVSRRESDAAGMVAKVDGWNTVVGDGRSGGECPGHLEAGIGSKVHGGRWCKSGWECWLSWPSKCGRWSGSAEECGILGDTDGLGWRKSWWWWAGVEAVERIVSAAYHGEIIGVDGLVTRRRL